MTYEEKEKMAAEFRAWTALDTGMAESEYTALRKNKVSPLLKDWQKNGKKMKRRGTHRIGA